MSCASLVPAGANLIALAAAARACRACPLWERGTQTVFGDGPADAPIMFVGEQPGDREDLAGRPFVGPAGGLFDEALRAAGLERAMAYVTNVVKHFKWEARGKRRIHQKPDARDNGNCRPWLDAEILALRPRVLVCLGSTAAMTLLGKSFRVTKDRGKLIPSMLAPKVLATIHPSAILRTPDDTTRAFELGRLVDDLEEVKKAL
jgi:uracil-DNA glycosylase